MSLLQPQLGESHLDISKTFGAMLIGTFVGLTLYGMVVHQSYRYFRLYPDDLLLSKLLVTLVLMLETFHMVITTHVCYHYLVNNYANPVALLSGTWSINLLTAMSGVIVMTSQSFFALRLYLLGRRYRAIVYISIPLLVGELGFFTAATVEAFIKPIFTDFQRYTWLISSGTATAQVSDLLLTSVLIVVLRKSRTGVERMDTVIETLMMYAVNTGLLTSIVNFLAFVFSLLFPKDLIYGAFGIVATKLYANSLLAALNARKSLSLRAMYDLDVSWVDVPINPVRASQAVRHGSSIAGLTTSRNTLPARWDITTAASSTQISHTMESPSLPSILRGK